MSSEEDINADSSPESPGNSKDNALFKPKPEPKILRVLTVLAYILSVSMAAIVLSVYYIFIWKEQKHDDTSVFTTHDSFTYNLDEDNTTEVITYSSDFFGISQKEMQQQIAETGGTDLFSTYSPSTADEATSPDYEESFDNEYGKRSTFIRKLISNKYSYPEND